MPIVQVKGRTYFQYDGKNYVLGSKPFEKLVNTQRKNGNRIFEGTIRFGGSQYTINPVLSGKGSKNPLVELDTTGLGALTKTGIKKLAKLDNLWYENQKILTTYIDADIETSIWELYKKLRERGGEARIIFNGNDITTAIPDYKAFRVLFKESYDDPDWLVDVGDKVVVVKPNNLSAEKLFQYFRDGIQHCVFEPILNKLKVRLENASSTSTQKRIKQRINTITGMKKEYDAGVPEDKMEQVAKASGFKIVMDIMGKPIKVWNENAREGTLSFRNTRENHLEEAGLLVSDRDFVIVSESEMDTLWASTKQMRNGEYMVEGDLKNDKPTKLHFLNVAYKVENKEQDIINEFNKEINLQKYKYNATANPDVNEFIKSGRIINSWVSGINNQNPTGHIDMTKAYAQFKQCSYYAGFLGVIHQWRTGTFDKQFIEKHIGMYRINITQCNNILLNKLGLYVGMTIVLPSPELLYFLDNGIDGVIDAGVWGGRMDFDFTDEMLDNRRYCIWAGQCGSEKAYKRYTFPGSEEWASHLKDVLPEAEIFYWGSKKLITVKLINKSMFTANHILAFITSYTRINMLQAMSQFNHNQLCNVLLDGIYYTGDKPNGLVLFRDKPVKKVSNLEGWYKNVDLNVSWSSVVYENNTMIAGQGGSGKTYSILTDKCYNRLLFVVPQHILGQKAVATYKGITYTTIHQLIGLETRPYIEKYSYPPVILIDELTQYSSEWIDKAFKLYDNSLIFIAGDIDKKGQWFQTRNGIPGNYSDIWKPTNVDYVYIEGDRRSRDEELKQLKLKIRETMRNVFIDGNSSEEIIMRIWAKNNLNTIMFNDAVKMFKNGEDTWIAGTHETNKMLLDNNVVSGYYREGGWISTTEKEGYNKRGSFTIHSYQGSTIENGKVFISLDDMFEYSMLYTAVSRAVHLEQLVFVKKIDAWV